MKNKDVADEFDFWAWDAPHFIFAEPFKDHIVELKKQFVGKKITAAHAMGVIFNNNNNVDLVVWDNNGYTCFDEPLVLVADGERLEIIFHNTSHAKIGVNTLTMKEKSYQKYAAWSDVSCLLPGIIGSAISDIRLTTFTTGFYDSVFLEDDGEDRLDGGDYFGSLLLIMDNGCVLSISGSEEYMDVLLSPARTT